MDFNIVPVAEASVETLMKSIDRVIINPIIFFMFAVAMVYFLYGVVQYFMSPGSEEVRKKSKVHMLWGIIGLFIMVGVFGIMKLIIGTLGVTNVKINSNGNFVVGDNSTLAADKTIKDDKKSNQDLFTGNIDVSSQDIPEYPLETFTTNPFATYQDNPKCWRPDPVPALYYKATTEYDALRLVRLAARQQYLEDNHVPKNDNVDMPLTYQTQVLYDKKHKIYYAWIDTRAPIDDGVNKDCNLKVIGPARGLPDPTILVDYRDGTNESITTVPKPKISDYTADPFPNDYIEHPNVCWHRDVMSTPSSTEYLSLQSLKTIARKLYLTQNNLTNATADLKWPKVFGVLSSYDAAHKLYYAWQDVRAPVGQGKIEDCNLLEQIQNSTRSTKPNPLVLSYFSDSSYYRVVDSGVDPTYVGARSKAIHNALLQIAKLEGTNDLSSIVYTVLPEEKYYPIDPVTKNYDYWLAVEAKRY